MPDEKGHILKNAQGSHLPSLAPENDSPQCKRLIWMIQCVWKASNAQIDSASWPTR